MFGSQSPAAFHSNYLIKVSLNRGGLTIWQDRKQQSTWSQTPGLKIKDAAHECVVTVSRPILV